jgi:hypothetical protein
MRVLTLMLLTLMLAGCGAPRPTYAEVQATAERTGCWPDPYPTPRSVTVTPIPDRPLDAALPTTTPYPRCAPPPDATGIPWPTPVPNPPPYPTREPWVWQGGSDQQTTLFLPSNVLTIDLAAHPTENWAAVGAVVWSGNSDPERAFVSVLHPHSRRWSPAHQVDLGPAQLGRYSRTIATAITGDRVVHAVWGMSDPDFTDNDPPSGIWTSQSVDFGGTWSPPQRIATDCRTVNDLAATTAGSLVALLVCHDGPDRSVPTLVVRSPDGVWQPPERLDVPVWPFSDGAIVITGEGEAARAVGLLFAGEGGVARAYLVSKELTSADPWLVQTRTLATGGSTFGERMWHVRGLSFERPQSAMDAPPAIVFTWSDAEAGGAYAMTSLDGGATWGAIETIALPQSRNEQIAFVTPAYDPAADRLVAVWTCCDLAQFAMPATTHYGAWSAPDSGIWLPEQDAPRVPLVLGSRSAFETVTAQARNSRMTWIAWVERQQQVVIRSLDLNQVIPIDAYTTGGRP